MTTVENARTSVGNILVASLLGGFIAGSADLIFAALYYPVSFQRIMQSVAAGALGREAAISGGWETAAIGGVCHYFISLCAAAAYVFASRLFPILTRQAVVFGPLFGIAMYFFMNAVVVPLSAAGRPLSWAFVTEWIPLLAHMFLFGLPIALIARWLAGTRQRA